MGLGVYIFALLLRRLSVFLFLISILNLESAWAQVNSCAPRLERAEVKQTDGFLPVYRFKGSKGFVIGIPKENLAQKYIFSTYLDQAISPFFGDYIQSSIIRFEESDKIIRVIETFANVTYAENSPLARTQKASLSDSRLVAFTKLSCNDDNYIYAIVSDRSLKTLVIPAVLEVAASSRVSANSLDVATSSVTAYKDNVNFSVDLNISTGISINGAANGRNFSARVSHSIIRLPDEGYKPRLADPSIGYLLVNRIDLSKLNQIENDQLIRRWRLEKKDPEADLSDPVKPILFWIENTTPYAFRAPIEKGILAWNEAFEAAGFTNAIEVKIQPDDASWEAGDINYNVVRWETSPYNASRLGFGPSFSDPRTGEILAADILLNFSGLARRVGDWLALGDYDWRDQEPPATVGTADPIASHNQSEELKLANRFIQNNGTGRSFVSESVQDFRALSYFNEEKIAAPRLARKPASDEFTKLIKFGGLIAEVTGRETSSKIDRIQSGEKIRSILSGDINNKQLVNAFDGTDNTGGGEGSSPQEQVFSRMITELVTDLTMHEVGHTLGLMHNFAASQYRDHKDIHDRDKTNGLLSASVMDYLPINFAPPGKEQGDFANTRVGPYDKWAIEYGYQPDLDQNKEALSRLLKKAGTLGHIYRGFSLDPSIRTFDLTTDPVAYALDALDLSQSLIKNSEDWSVRENTNTNIQIYNQVLRMRLQALSIIIGQLEPFGVDIDPSFERSDRNRIIVSLTPKEHHLEALDALGKGIFFADQEAWKVPSSLTKRLGDYARVSTGYDGGRAIIADQAISRLLSPYRLIDLLSASERGPEAITGAQYLRKVREIVVGNDFGPLGRPSLERQRQQYTYIQEISNILRIFESSPVLLQLLGIPTGSSIDLRRALQKELSIIERDLSLPYFWLPRDVKRHREELLQIIQ